jgi:stage III sporulation protein AH
MKLWKRNAVVAAIALFVCVAVYLNWSYTHDADKKAAAGKTLGEAALVGSNRNDPLRDGGDEGEGMGSGYFSTARLNRQQARDSALDLLQQAAADEKAPQESIDEANATIQTMAKYTLAEAQIENLISAKGYSDCVAFLSDNSISIVVAATKDGLTEVDTARIRDIVVELTELTAGQIKIIETNP